MPDTTSARRPRVVLVRQWDQQVGGSGCCGRLSSSAAESLGGENPFGDARADMEAMGAVYRALRERCPADELDLTVADPRNTAWLLPTIWRDARRRGLGALAALRQVHLGTSPQAVICDGLVVATDVSDAEAAVTAVLADLDDRSDRPGRTDKGA